VSKRSPAAAPATTAKAWLSPRLLLPVIGLLGAAVVALGVMLALGVNGDSSHTVTLKPSCKVGEPGCTLREPTHQHANFALFIEGKKFDFNTPQFVSEEGKEKSGYAHIHPPRYEVVHVHQTKTTWAEFFATVGIDLKDPSLGGIEARTTCLKLPDGRSFCSDGAKKLQFVVNGVKVDGISDKEINDLDRVLISYGAASDDDLLKEFAQVATDACIPSERCKDRIPANEPEEPCTGAGACTGS
jgi:hypothetical protein